jgi:hypothetical protein
VWRYFSSQTEPVGYIHEDGIPVIRDYFGPGMPRVVFEKELDRGSPRRPSVTTETLLL